MDLVQNLRIFRRVAEKASFSAVAAEFRVTQPTISKAIAALENALGVALFRRSTRGLSLTSEGQKLLNGSSSVIEQIDSLLASVKNEKLLLDGILRITASLAFSRLILAPLLEKFFETHPKIKFHFQLNDGYVDLIENRIDLAIRIGDLPDSNLKAFKIGVSRRAFYAAKSYTKKFGIPRNLGALKNHRLMFYTRLSDRPGLPLMGEDGKPFNFQFEPHLQSDGSDLIRESVLQGNGIAYLPTWMMKGRENESLMIKTLSKYAGPASPIYLVTSGNQDLGVKQRVFTEFLRTELEKISALSMR